MLFDGPGGFKGLGEAPCILQEKTAILEALPELHADGQTVLETAW